MADNQTPNSLKPETQVKSRNEQFDERIATSIWQEIASDSNPYVAAEARCHGYNVIELIKHQNYINVIYLLFQGELPTPEQARLLETLFIALINPGPRQPATQAAMNAGVSKVDYAHILPIALAIQGGLHLGGKEVELSMRFLTNHISKPAAEVACGFLGNSPQPDGDWHIAPGFGTCFGSIDIMSQQMAETLINQPAAGQHLHWAQEFVNTIFPSGLGWLTTGIAAATLSDLGFSARTGAGMFQLMSAPGLLAHGTEMAGKPLTAIPFIGQENYVIE